VKFKRHVRLETGLKQIEITPLIDCVFLLLIFFMLTSNFIVVHGINIKLPKSSTSETVDNQNITIQVSSEDIVYINGEPLTYMELKDFLSDKSLESIFIKADKDATLGVVTEIWDICRQVGIEKIGIATAK